MTRQKALTLALTRSKDDYMDYVVVPVYRLGKPDTYAVHSYLFWLASNNLPLFVVRVAPDGSRHTY